MMRTCKDLMEKISEISPPYQLIAIQTYPSNGDFRDENLLKQRGEVLEAFSHELQSKNHSLETFRILWEQCVAIDETHSLREIAELVKESLNKELFAVIEFRIIVAVIETAETFDSLEPLLREVISKNGFSLKRSSFKAIRMINNVEQN